MSRASPAGNFFPRHPETARHRGNGQIRLVQYNHHFHPSVGGTEQSGRILARELSAAGLDVTVITRSQLGGRQELAEGYRILRGKGPGPLLSAVRTADAVLSRGGLSLRCAAAAAWHRTPLAVFHEIEPFAPGEVTDLPRRSLLPLKRRLLALAGLHVGVSKSVLSGNPIPSGAPAFCLYNPVDETFRPRHIPGPSERSIDILFVGRMVSSKGIFVLADAVKRLLALRPLRVVFVGDGPARADLRRLFVSTGQLVAFTGNLPPDAVARHMAAARVLAIPSLFREGMGMVAAEAMSSGTPLCVSDQPALVEVGGAAALVHPAGHAESLAGDIERLLADSDMWQRMSRSALTRSELFSMQAFRRAVRDRLIPQLETLAAGRPRPRLLPRGAAWPSS